jgi:protoheme IX farnesyltransferase
LGKFRIAQLVTLSTATGYILAKGSINLDMLYSVSGIFFMAMGSGAFNQFQEREADGLMLRTQNRPIPSGRISLKSALLVSIALFLTGGIILILGTNSLAFYLGILTAFWYNVIYTYLKKITSFAVFPGAVIGALPPLVGWASVTGDIFSAQPFALAIFFFIWQIPHFWLLLLNFGDDYTKAGYPSLTKIFNKNQLGRLTFVWILATAVSLLLFPLFGLGRSQTIYLLLILSAIFLVWRSIYLLRPKKIKLSFSSAFISINIFILAVMILLTLDRLFYMG